MIGKLWILASIWHRAIEIWRILPPVRILRTRWNRNVSLIWFLVIRCLKVRMNLSQALHRLQKSQLQLGNLRWAEEPLFFFFSFAFVILGGGNVQETGDCCQLWHNQQEGRWRSESLESKLFLMEFVVRWATWRAPPLSLGTRIVGRRNINGERPLIGSSGITLYYNADHVIPPCLVTLV